MKLSRVLVPCGLFLCVAGAGLLISLYWSPNNLTFSDPSEATSRRQIKQANFGDNNTPPDNRTKRPKRVYNLLDLPENSDLHKVNNRLRDALEELESGRIRLIGEQDRLAKSGMQTWYLIGIELPNDEQIEKAKSLIAEAMDCVEISSREELDKRIGEMVEMYNTFGTQGKKAAIIKIPHDAEKRMVALVYRSDNFEEEKKKLDPEIPFHYRFDQLNIYFREDAEVLDRFSKIIK